MTEIFSKKGGGLVKLFMWKIRSFSKFDAEIQIFYLKQAKIRQSLTSRVVFISQEPWVVLG